MTSLVRPTPARMRFGVGKTKFMQDIAPRLQRVQIGPRATSFTDSSIEALIQEMAAETANMPKVMPAPNLRRRDVAASNKKRRGAPGARR